MPEPFLGGTGLKASDTEQTDQGPEMLQSAPGGNSKDRCERGLASLPAQDGAGGWLEVSRRMESEDGCKAGSKMLALARSG